MTKEEIQSFRQKCEVIFEARSCEETTLAEEVCNLALKGLGTQAAEAALYVPGALRCPKCGLELVVNVLNMAAGKVHAADVSKREVCPNDGADMVRVTWEERYRDSYKACERITGEKQAAEAERDRVTKENRELKWLLDSYRIAGKETRIIFALKDEKEHLATEKQAALERARKTEESVKVAIKYCFIDAQRRAGKTKEQAEEDFYEYWHIWHNKIMSEIAALATASEGKPEKEG